MAQAPSSKKTRVLIIDDNVDMKTILSVILENLGVEVCLADSGKNAVDLFLKYKGENKPFDLVITDIHMPDLDGYATAKLLRENGHTGTILAFTANASMSGKKTSKESGIDGYFSKTTIKKDLVEALLAQYCP